MKSLIGLAIALTIAFAPALPARAADRIAVVAAENFYGGVAREIGGERVAVISILNNPDQDPHLFETTPTVVRQVAAAQVVVLNGAGYDSWMEKLLAVSPKPDRAVIAAADLMHQKAGGNPHLWYDPRTMPAVAGALAAALTTADPAHKNEYAARLKTFLASLAPLNDKIAAIRGKYAGTPVTATEPVFGDMAAALGLTMHNERFQLAVMNGTEPAARDFAQFEQSLKGRAVRVLFYNTQARSNLVTHLVDLAHASHVGVVGVTETAPSGATYLAWMLSELDATAKALGEPTS
ncbi:MAG TPA: zinc ABC transporter substrate-binding protein [Xanthobacteraceae bacterium]|nr:zinc ABC transporter substrate-binding protein [Xanthobacteraceae bacterium]